MEIDKIYYNRHKTWKLMIFISFLSFILNLEGLHNWAEQKQATKLSLLLIKLTEAFNYLGNETGLNILRSNIKSQLVAFKNWELRKSTVNSQAFSREIANISVDNALIPPLDNTIQESLEDDESEDLNALLIDAPAESKAKFLLIGDSILKSGLQMHFQTRLTKKFPESEIEIKSQSGTGLSRPEVYNWLSYIENLKSDYEQVFIFLGTNDAQNILQNNKILSFGTKEWEKEYSSRLRGLINQACLKAKRVFWIGALKMKSESFDKKMNILNTIARNEILNLKGCAEFVNVSQWITEKNKFAEHLMVDKKSVKVRMPDGIHLSYWGALLFSKKLAEYVVNKNETVSTQQ